MKIAECSQKAAGQHIDLPPPPSDDGLTPASPEDVRRQNFVKAKAFAGIGTRAFRVLAEAMPQSPGAARTALRHGGRSESVPIHLLYSHDSGGMIRASPRLAALCSEEALPPGICLDVRQNFSAPAVGVGRQNPIFRHRLMKDSGPLQSAPPHCQYVRHACWRNFTSWFYRKSPSFLPDPVRPNFRPAIPSRRGRVA